LDLFPGMYLITSTFNFRILIQYTASEYDNMAPPGEMLGGVNEQGCTLSTRPSHSISFILALGERPSLTGLCSCQREQNFSSDVHILYRNR
jgi:hypothetical protein